MSITLEHRAGDVAVLRGVTGSAALIHLSRSLTSGAVFDDCRGLVVDLGGTVADVDLAAAMDEATRACLRRRLVVAFAADAGEVGPRLRVVRSLLRLLERERGLDVALRLARMHASAFAGAATGAFELASVPARRALRHVRSPAPRVRVADPPGGPTSSRG